MDYTQCFKCGEEPAIDRHAVFGENCLKEQKLCIACGNNPPAHSRTMLCSEACWPEGIRKINELVWDSHQRWLRDAGACSE